MCNKKEAAQIAEKKATELNNELRQDLFDHINKTIHTTAPETKELIWSMQREFMKEISELRKESAVTAQNINSMTLLLQEEREWRKNTWPKIEESFATKADIARIKKRADDFVDRKDFLNLSEDFRQIKKLIWAIVLLFAGSTLASIFVSVGLPFL
jgi:hypothetical protein